MAAAAAEKRRRQNDENGGLGGKEEEPEGEDKISISREGRRTAKSKRISKRIRKKQGVMKPQPACCVELHTDLRSEEHTLNIF
jgi:hypothetical protein